MQSSRIQCILLLLGFFLAPGALRLHGAGSGLNVVVVVNARSEASVRLGNYYAERRGIPPQNVLRMEHPLEEGVVNWSHATLQSRLLQPLDAMIAARNLQDQALFVVLSMDIPYRTTRIDGTNSTTSVLYYGFKPDDPHLPGTCTLSSQSTNAYFASESRFRDRPPASSRTPYLAAMITGATLEEATMLVDQGVAGDATFPGQVVLLIKTSDPARNIRHRQFDHAIFNSRLLGRPNLLRAESNGIFTPGGAIFGAHTGWPIVEMPAGFFLPGSIADTLTSFAGCILDPQGQTTALDFVRAGAAGSYGTVVEPCNYAQKFPATLVYFYQGRGFSLAESYYLSLQNPYQGLLLGEPLSAPYARNVLGGWSTPEGAVLSGTAPLGLHLQQTVQPTHVDRIDLFVDGQFFSTLLHHRPSPGNRISVQVRNVTVEYEVGPNETLSTVASNLAARLNEPAVRSATQVGAAAVGDRVELRLEGVAVSPGDATVLASASAGSAAARTTGITAARDRFLPSEAFGYALFTVSGTPVTGSSLALTVTRLDQSQSQVTVTHSGGTLRNLVQALVDAVNSHPSLQGADGVLAENVADFLGGSAQVQFDLRARSPGWPAARIQAELTASPPLSASPSGTTRLERNLDDLKPRNQLWLQAGVLSGNWSFPVDTTLLPDGPHQFTAVFYEGTHMHSQTLVHRQMEVRNGNWDATLSIPDGGPLVAVEGTIHPRITAGPGSITALELHATGGLVERVENQSQADFALPASRLGVGLHPLHALAYRSDGSRVRTQTLWVRVVDRDYPLDLSMPAAGTLHLNGAAGRTYEILSAGAPEGPWTVRDSVTVSGAGPHAWNDPSAAEAGSRFYQIRIP